jgi:hypothetical protein
MGCNWLSFESEGVEYMVGAGKMNDKAFLLGSPVLYPTPNRVRGAVMTFEGREFRFPPITTATFCTVSSKIIPGQRMRPSPRPMHLGHVAHHL